MAGLGGIIQKDGKSLIIDAKVDYEFLDLFTDPFNIRQNKIGSSKIEDVSYDFSKPWWNSRNLAGASFVGDSEWVIGTPYEITGKWSTRITGSIPLN